MLIIEINIKCIMNYLMVTRFNNNTQKENERWRLINNYTGCIYNAPIPVKDTIPLEIPLYVIEMNNNVSMPGFNVFVN